MSPPDALPIAIGLLIDPSRNHAPARILIAQRQPGQVLAGYWEFPGGKIEPGETPAQAVEREFMEELGLAVQARTPLPMIEHAYAHGKVRLHPWLCVACDGQSALPNHAGCRWVALHELPGYPFPAANAPLIADLAAQRIALPGAAFDPESSL